MLLRVSLCLVASAALVIACSGATGSAVATASSSGGSSGQPSTSSGAVASSSSGSSRGALIDVTGATAIIASSDLCGKPAGSCGDAQRFTVDLQNSNVVHTTCVETGDGGAGAQTENVDQKRSLTADDIEKVRTSLAAIHTAPLQGGEDGRMFALQILRASSSQLYSPGVYCGDTTQFIGIDSTDFAALWTTIGALGD